MPCSVEASSFFKVLKFFLIVFLMNLKNLLAFNFATKCFSKRFLLYKYYYLHIDGSKCTGYQCLGRVLRSSCNRLLDETMANLKTYHGVTADLVERPKL